MVNHASKVQPRCGFKSLSIAHQRRRKALLPEVLSTCQFLTRNIGRYSCEKPHCSDLNARLIYRIEEFENGKAEQWQLDTTATEKVQLKKNEDLIEANDELIQLLKIKTKQVKDQNAKSRDRRGMFN